MDIEGLEQERPPENSSTILTYSELERRCLTLEESNQSLVNMCSRLINNFESRKKHFTKNLSRLLDQNSDLMEKYVDLVRHNNEVSSSLEVMDKLIRTMKENLNNCLNNVGIERTVQESVLQEGSTVCDPLPTNSYPIPSDESAQESIRVQSGRQNFSKINPMSPIQEEVATPIKSRSHPTLHSFKKFDISDSTSISNPRKTIGTVFPSCPETCAELSSSSEKVGLKRSLLGLKHLRKAIGPETLSKNVPHDETIQVEPSGVEQLSSDYQTRKNQHENFRLVDTKSKRTETSIAESSMGNLAFGTDLQGHGIFGAISCSEVETFESLAKKSKVMADVNVDKIPVAGKNTSRISNPTIETSSSDLTSVTDSKSREKSISGESVCPNSVAGSNAEKNDSVPSTSSQRKLNCAQGPTLENESRVARKDVRAGVLQESSCNGQNSLNGNQTGLTDGSNPSSGTSFAKNPCSLLDPRICLKRDRWPESDQSDADPKKSVDSPNKCRVTRSKMKASQIARDENSHPSKKSTVKPDEDLSVQGEEKFKVPKKRACRKKKENVSPDGCDVSRNDRSKVSSKRVGKKKIILDF